MKLDREALISPKLLIGGGAILLGFVVIALLYFQTVALGDQVIQLLQQGDSANTSRSVERLMEERNAKHSMLTIASIVFAFLISAVAIAVSQSIIGPLRRAVEYADDIAQGKLGDRANYWASGEVASVRDAVSDMQDQLTHVVMRVSTAADQVSEGSSSIDHSTRVLHGHFSEQAESLARVTSGPCYRENEADCQLHS